MRRFLQWLLIVPSGCCLVVGSYYLLSTIEINVGLLAQDYGNQAMYLADMGAVLVGAIVWRGIARARRVQRRIATVAGVVAGILLVLFFLMSMGMGYASTKKSAYVAAMKSDLRNLVTAEEAFFADSARYTTDLASLRFRPSSGVTRPVITVTRDGWTATVDHERLRRTCVVYVGHTSIAPATHEGEPACAPERFDLRDYLVPLELLGVALLLGGLAALFDRPPSLRP